MCQFFKFLEGGQLAYLVSKSEDELLVIPLVLICTFITQHDGEKAGQQWADVTERGPEIWGGRECM